MDKNADAIIGLYDRHAKTWDRNRGRVLLEGAWLDRFCALIPVGGSILDIGCGSGDPIGRRLIETGYCLTGVDSSQNLIALCRDKFPGVEFLVADMRRLDLGRTFEGLIAWGSVFHLTPDDQRATLPVFARHAAPGAALMFTSGDVAAEAVGEFAGEPLYHGSLDPAEYRTLLDANGFDLVAHLAGDPDCGEQTVWLAQRRG